VKNAPYSAAAISASVQVLADGNRIVKETRTLLYRDSYGRTRQERNGPHGTRVYVFDPNEDRSFALNPDKRTSIRIPRVPAPPAPPAPPVGESSYRLANVRREEPLAELFRVPAGYRGR
jgi:hypothetical protein